MTADPKPWSSPGSAETLPWADMRKPRDEQILRLVIDLGAGETATIYLEGTSQDLTPRVVGARGEGVGKRHDLIRLPTILKQQVLLVHHEGEGRSNRVGLSAQTTTMDRDNLRQIRQ